ncbi:hypothetical protein [Mycobacterium sp. URHB0021]
MAERIPGAEFVVVEGVGSSHGMIYERLDEGVDPVREHLRLVGQHVPAGRPTHG